MKIWRWLAALLVLLVLGAYIFLGWGYLTQNSHTKAKLTELSGLKAVLSMIPDIPADLDQRLAAARAELAAAESAFAGETDGTVIIDTVLRLADEAGVKGVPLSSHPWADEHISNTNFSVFHLSVEVTGNFQQIRSYLELLKNSGLNTMAVRYLKVVRVSANPDANMTADLDVAVYALVPTAR
jgi:hypothetical protein